MGTSRNLDESSPEDRVEKKVQQEEGEERKEGSPWIPGGRIFQAEGMACAKALRRCSFALFLVSKQESG